MSSSQSRTERAEAAYAAFLEAREDSQHSFEDLCAAHPDLSPDLRRIHSALDWADDLLEPDVGDEADGVPLDLRSGEERYDLRGEIDRGGMGVIFEVFDHSLKRTLAMKVLQTGRAMERRAIARFLEEAQVTGQLEHPSIVPIYDVGKLSDGRLYYTMPLVRGRTLADVFDLAQNGREGWSLTRALGVVLTVCDAVGAAHEHGVVHRDLKPENVMVGAHGEVYVMDWGLARILGAPATASGAPASDPDRAVPRSDRRELIARSPDSTLGTIDGQIVGTPSFMPPEQARGDVEAIGPPSDVYAAGALLYMLLTGSRPYHFEGEPSGSRIVLERLLEGPPPSVHQCARDVPAELAAICDRAMQREASERYPNMTALAGDLRAFLEHRVVRAYRTGTWAELGKWVQRNRALATASVLGIATLAAGLVVSLSLKAEADRETARADESARQATVHFEAALDAIDRALTEVANDSLSDVPAAQAVRRNLLEDARELYEGLLVEEGDDVGMRLRVARAHGRLADINSELDDSEASLRYQEQALAEFRAIAADAPETPRIRREVVFALLDLARAHQSAYRDEAGRKYAREAIESIAALLGERPDDEELLRQEAAALGVMGTLYLRDDPAQCEEWLTRSTRAFEDYLALPPSTQVGVDFAQLRLGENVRTLAKMLLLSGDLERAKEPTERAVRIAEEALAREPGDQQHRTRLADSYNNRTVLYAQLEPGGEEALRSAERVIELRQALHADYPNVVHHLHSVGQALTNLALVKSDGGHNEEAVATIEEALRWGQRVLERAPNEEKFKRALGGYYQNLFWILNVLGLHAEIAERVPEVVAVDPEAGLPYRRTAATAFGYCATNVLADASLDEGERQRLQEAYLDDMVRLFHELADRGYIDPDYLDREWFTAVRQHPKVERLVADLTERKAAIAPPAAEAD